MCVEKYDVIVIGGGPGGYSAAIKSAQEGLKTLLFEGKDIGGTCLNEGCIPTKYLLDKAAMLERIRELTNEKILKSAGYFSLKKIQKGKEETVRKLTNGVKYLLKANGVEVISKNALLKKVGLVECDGRLYRGENIILATGSEAVKIPIPGVDFTITSKEALKLLKVPKRLTVIGGGVIGMELASAFCSFGSEVTVVEVLPELFPREDRKVVSYLEKEIKKQGIQILCKTKVKEIRNKSDVYLVKCENLDDGKRKVIQADLVLLAVGRKASLCGIDAKRLGLKLTSKKEIAVDQYMQTNLEHVYAIGDVAGGYQLAHAAYAEAEVAIDHILGKKIPIDFSVLPRCIYTRPAFASTGLGEKDAYERNIEIALGEFSYAGNGMALVEGAEGLIRVLMDKKNKQTLGVQIVGECAPELINFASLAVKNKMTLEEWRRLIIAHPSLSEMMKEAVCDCFGKSIHGVVKK